MERSFLAVLMSLYFHFLVFFFCFTLYNDSFFTSNLYVMLFSSEKNKSDSLNISLMFHIKISEPWDAASILCEL